MRKRPGVIVVHLAVLGPLLTLLGLSCATPTQGAGEVACVESQDVCLGLDSDCTVDTQRRCVLCVCGQRQGTIPKEGSHEPTR